MRTDWSCIEAYPTCVCFCRCGTSYSSQVRLAAYIENQGASISWSRITHKPCPGCGRRDGCSKVSNEPVDFCHLESSKGQPSEDRC